MEYTKAERKEMFKNELQRRNRRGLFFVSAWVCFFPGLLCLAVYLLTHHFNHQPGLEGRVTDLAHIISPAAKTELSDLLSEHEKQTTNQVVVATVTSLNGKPLELYSNSLFRNWQLGQKNKNNGVLLLIAPTEHKVRIEVGYGLESTLTDAICNNIIEIMILPQFRNGNMEAGIMNGTKTIVELLNHAPPVQGGNGTSNYATANQVMSRPVDDENKDLINQLLIISLIFPCLYIIFRIIARLLSPYFKDVSFNTSSSTTSSHSSTSSTSSSSSSSSSSSFSGGGGSSGGGGASGSW